MNHSLVLGYIFCLLAACNQDKSASADYLNRLENVLERKAIAAEPFVLLNFPSKRELILDPPQASLSIREFLSLRECKIHAVIAHRNSSLGKVASASQKLFNDFEILHHGPACLEHLNDNDLRRKLAQFLTEKETNLPTTLWQSMLGQQEYSSFWRSKNYDNYPAELTLETIPDLVLVSEFINRVLAGQRSFTKQQTSKIEQHLGRLRFGDGGELLWHYQRLGENLKQANSIIKQRIQSPLCPQKKSTQQARFLSNVVNNYFIKHVQTNAVQLNQRAKKLEPVLRQLEEPLLIYAHPLYIQWRNRRNIIFEQSKSATMLHVQLLQELYSQCGLTPGKPQRTE